MCDIKISLQFTNRKLKHTVFESIFELRCGFLFALRVWGSNWRDGLRVWAIPRVLRRRSRGCCGLRGKRGRKSRRRRPKGRRGGRGCSNFFWQGRLWQAGFIIGLRLAAVLTGGVRWNFIIDVGGDEQLVCSQGIIYTVLKLCLVGDEQSKQVIPHHTVLITDINATQKHLQVFNGQFVNSIPILIFN